MVNNTLIIAHRGESYDAPENSLSSINLAWLNNDKAVEIDVHLTLDCEVVVYHDFNTKRLSGEKKVIKDSTLRELKELNIGNNNSEYSNEKIPTLTEVLDTLPPDKKIIIEIKCGPEITTHIAKIIKSKKIKNTQIEFISFNYKTVLEMKRLLPEFRSLLILNLLKSFLIKFLNPYFNWLIVKITRHNLNGIDVSADCRISEGIINKLKTKGLLLYTYTVNDIEEAERLITIGIDGIATDRAKWLRDNLLLDNE